MKENLKFEKIYDEIPFNIINSPLDKALFYEYQDDIFKKEEKEQINIMSLLENNMLFYNFQ